MKQLQTALENNSKKIDKFFDLNLPAPIGINKKLLKAIRYSTIGSGKKIRGFLVVETGKMLLKNNYEKVLNSKELIIAASAIEAIHSYSLIHDDLPAIDNSDLRRGKKSTHKKFDEATAILVGDALQSWAFEIISNTNFFPDTKKSTEMVFNLSKSIGMSGMVGGQQADINFEDKNISSNDIHWIQEKKTGSLIECCVKFGSIIIKSSQIQKNDLIEYSKNLGIAFQIADDLLDLKGNRFMIGKPVKQDIINNTPNFVNLLGEEQARKKSKIIVEKAIECLKNFGNNAKNLVLLARYSINREF